MTERRRRRVASDYSEEDKSNNPTVESYTSDDGTYEDSELSYTENDDYSDRTIEDEETDTDSDTDTDDSGGGGRRRHSDDEGVCGDQEEDDDPDFIDADQDKSNPAFIPRSGNFYEHDSRGVDLPTRKPAELVSRTDKLRRWSHDCYDEREQTTKSRDQVINEYGYDIRARDAAPEEMPDSYNPVQERRLGDYIPDNFNQRRGRRGRGSPRGGGRGGGNAGSGGAYNNMRANNYGEQDNGQSQPREVGHGTAQSHGISGRGINRQGRRQPFNSQPQELQDNHRNNRNAGPAQQHHRNVVSAHQQQQQQHHQSVDRDQVRYDQQRGQGQGQPPSHQQQVKPARHQRPSAASPPARDPPMSASQHRQRQQPPSASSSPAPAAGIRESGGPRVDTRHPPTPRPFNLAKPPQNTKDAYGGLQCRPKQEPPANPGQVSRGHAASDERAAPSDPRLKQSRAKQTHVDPPKREAKPTTGDCANPSTHRSSDNKPMARRVAAAPSSAAAPSAGSAAAADSAPDADVEAAKQVDNKAKRYSDRKVAPEKSAGYSGNNAAVYYKQPAGEPATKANYANSAALPKRASAAIAIVNPKDNTEISPDSVVQGKKAESSSKPQDQLVKSVKKTEQAQEKTKTSKQSDESKNQKPLDNPGEIDVKPNPDSAKAKNVECGKDFEKDERAEMKEETKQETKPTAALKTSKPKAADDLKQSDDVKKADESSVKREEPEKNDPKDLKQSEDSKEKVDSTETKGKPEQPDSVKDKKQDTSEKQRKEPLDDTATGGSAPEVIETTKKEQGNVNVVGDQKSADDSDRLKDKDDACTAKDQVEDVKAKIELMSIDGAGDNNPVDSKESTAQILDDLPLDQE